MSDETIEDKFEEWIKGNAMNRLYMSDYFRAGYEVAQKELQKELDEAIEVIKFYADKDNWKNMKHCQGDEVSKVRIEAQDYYEDNSISDKKYLNLIGGKRARDFLKARRE